MNFFEKIREIKDNKEIKKAEKLASHVSNTSVGEVNKINEEIIENDEKRIHIEDTMENLGLNHTTKVSPDIEEEYMNSLEKGADLEDKKFNLIKGN